MQRLKSESGMTLIIVLITITVFSVLGLAVMGATLSNAKQVKKVEKNVQTVDLAEMGVQYYQARLTDFFHEQISVKRQEVRDLIAVDYQNNKAVTDDGIENYEILLAQKLMTAYNGSIFAPTNTSIIEKTVDSTSPIRKFKIDRSTAVITCPTCTNGQIDDKQQLVLTYKSLGFTDQLAEKQLTAKFVFTFAIDKSEIKEIGIPLYKHDYQTLIPKPTGLPICSSEITESGKSKGRDSLITTNCQFNDAVKMEKPSEITNSKLIFDKGLTFNSQINKGIEDSILYITGDTTFNKHINGVHDTKILVKGKAKFETINQGIHNSTIVVEGDVKFGEQQDKFKDLEHSSIYIIGNADFTDMDFQHFSTTSKICISGNVIGGSNLSSYPIYSSSINKILFDEKCSIGVIENGDKTIDISDQFLDWDENISPIVQYN